MEKTLLLKMIRDLIGLHLSPIVYTTYSTLTKIHNMLHNIYKYTHAHAHTRTHTHNDADDSRPKLPPLASIVSTRDEKIYIYVVNYYKAQHEIGGGGRSV